MSEAKMHVEFDIDVREHADSIEEHKVALTYWLNEMTIDVDCDITNITITEREEVDRPK